MFREVNRLVFELLYLKHFPFELSYLGCLPAGGDVSIDAALLSLTASRAILKPNTTLLYRLDYSL